MRRIWTPDEDAIIRAHGGKRGGFARACALLPERTPHAVQQRISTLGIPRAHRRWTPREDKVLALEWGEISPRTLRSKLPGRSWPAIVDRARVLGLPAPQQETISLDEAARRAGYATDTMRKILAAEGVEIAPYRGGACADGREMPRWRVDAHDALEAVEAHLSRVDPDRETLAEAAQRTGINRLCLKARIATLGIRPLTGGGKGSLQRFARADIDRVVAHVPHSTRRGGLVQACAAAGESYAHAIHVARALGLTGQRGAAHTADECARILAELRARRAA